MVADTRPARNWVRPCVKACAKQAAMKAKLSAQQIRGATARMRAGSLVAIMSTVTWVPSRKVTAMDRCATVTKLSSTRSTTPGTAAGMMRENGSPGSREISRRAMSASVTPTMPRSAMKATPATNASGAPWAVTAAPLQPRLGKRDEAHFSYAATRSFILS